MHARHDGTASSQSQTGLNTRHLSPGYFAFVMATGIVAVGAHLRGFMTLATVLLSIATLGYLVLICLNIWRFTKYRSNFVNDAKNPQRAFGYFTFIAATNVVAAALVGNGQIVIACVLLAVSFPLWIVLG